MAGSDGVEVTDADAHSELLLQFPLQLAALNLRGCLQPRLKPVQHSRKHFRRVSLSAISQRGFSSRAHLLLPTIGGGPTHLDARGRCGYLPGLTSLHQLGYLLFGCLSLLLLHDGFFPFSLTLLSAICPLS
jgi:hypothetical protein